MIKKYISVLVIIITIVSIGYVGADAALPEKISFQGQLQDSDGQPVEGSKSITFKIYDALTGGNLLKTVQTDADIDSNGLYTVDIDVSGISLDKTLYLSLKVGTDSEMKPRIKVLPSVSAIYAKTAASATTATTATTANGVAWGNITSMPASFADGVDDASTASLSADSIGGWNIIDSTITTADIFDGTIVNADISGSAAIADSKLAQIATADKVASGAIAAGSLPADVIASSAAVSIVGPLQVMRDADYDILVSSAKYVSGGGGSGDNFGNHVATQSIDGGTFDIFNVAYASFTNTYATGYSSATVFYGDGSQLAGIPSADNLGNHTATQSIDGATFDIFNVAYASFTNTYATGYSSATVFYGDGSQLAGIPSADNLGNHTATQSIDGATFDIFNVAYASFTNTYATGYSSATVFYGDGSQLAGIPSADNLGNHTATQSIDGATFDIFNVAYASFTNTYATGYSSATVFYGDGSQLAGIPSADNLGNHTATQSIDGATFDIFNVAYASFTNTYATGYSSATLIYGNGANITAVNADQLDGQDGSYYAADAKAEAISVSTGTNRTLVEAISLSTGTNKAAIDLNTTHRSSVGTDHTYIDQDLQTTAIVTHAGFLATSSTFTNTYASGYSSATVFYGDGSQLAGIQTSGGDDFGNHIATQSIDGGTFDIFNVVYASFTNTYASGYSSATIIYGNGANITAVNADQLDGQDGSYYAADAKAEAISVSTGTNRTLVEAISLSTGTNKTAIDLNTTHRSSVGTDHTYIDQDLQTTAIVTHAGFLATSSTFTNTYASGYSSATVFYGDGSGLTSVLNLSGGTMTGDIGFGWTAAINEASAVGSNEFRVKGNSASAFTSTNSATSLFEGVKITTTTAIGGGLKLDWDVDPTSAPEVEGILGIDRADWTLWISTSTNANGWQKVGAQN